MRGCSVSLEFRLECELQYRRNVAVMVGCVFNCIAQWTSADVALFSDTSEILSTNSDIELSKKSGWMLTR